MIPASTSHIQQNDRSTDGSTTGNTDGLDSRDEVVTDDAIGAGDGSNDQEILTHDSSLSHLFPNDQRTGATCGLQTQLSGDEKGDDRKGDDGKGGDEEGDDEEGDKEKKDDEKGDDGKGESAIQMMANVRLIEGDGVQQRENEHIDQHIDQCSKPNRRIEELKTTFSSVETSNIQSERPIPQFSTNTNNGTLKSSTDGGEMTSLKDDDPSSRGSLSDEPVDQILPIEVPAVADSDGLQSGNDQNDAEDLGSNQTEPLPSQVETNKNDCPNGTSNCQKGILDVVEFQSDGDGTTRIGPKPKEDEEEEGEIEEDGSLDDKQTGPLIPRQNGAPYSLAEFQILRSRQYRQALAAEVRWLSASYALELTALGQTNTLGQSAGLGQTLPSDQTLNRPLRPLTPSSAYERVGSQLMSQNRSFTSSNVFRSAEEEETDGQNEPPQRLNPSSLELPADEQRSTTIREQDETKSESLRSSQFVPTYFEGRQAEVDSRLLQSSIECGSHRMILSILRLSVDIPALVKYIESEISSPIGVQYLRGVSGRRALRLDFQSHQDLTRALQCCDVYATFIDNGEFSLPPWKIISIGRIPRPISHPSAGLTSQLTSSDGKPSIEESTTSSSHSFGDNDRSPRTRGSPISAKVFSSTGVIARDSSNDPLHTKSNLSPSLTRSSPKVEPSQTLRTNFIENPIQKTDIQKADFPHCVTSQSIFDAPPHDIFDGPNASCRPRSDSNINSTLCQNSIYKGYNIESLFFNDDDYYPQSSPGYHSTHLQHWPSSCTVGLPPPPPQQPLHRFSARMDASLEARKLRPVSLWCEHMNLEQQAEDYRGLVSRFGFTNRYALLRNLPPKLRTTAALSEFVLKTSETNEDFEVVIMEHEDSDGANFVAHISFKTKKGAQTAARKMQEKFDATPSLAFPGMELELTGPRKPNFTLWIGNIRDWTVHVLSWTDFVAVEPYSTAFLELFKYFGRVQRLKMMPERNCAFVEYESTEHAKCARNHLHGAVFGRPGREVHLNVDFSAGELGPNQQRQNSTSQDCRFCNPALMASYQESLMSALLTHSPISYGTISHATISHGINSTEHGVPRLKDGSRGLLSLNRGSRSCREESPQQDLVFRDPVASRSGSSQVDEFNSGESREFDSRDLDSREFADRRQRSPTISSRDAPISGTRSKSLLSLSHNNSSSSSYVNRSSSNPMDNKNESSVQDRSKRGSCHRLGRSHSTARDINTRSTERTGEITNDVEKNSGKMSNADDSRRRFRSRSCSRSHSHHKSYHNSRNPAMSNVKRSSLSSEYRMRNRQCSDTKDKEGQSDSRYRSGSSHGSYKRIQMDREPLGHSNRSNSFDSRRPTRRSSQSSWSLSSSRSPKRRKRRRSRRRHSRPPRNGRGRYEGHLPPRPRRPESLPRQDKRYEGSPRRYGGNSELNQRSSDSVKKFDKQLKNSCKEEIAANSLSPRSHSTEKHPPPLSSRNDGSVQKVACPGTTTRSQTQDSLAVCSSRPINRAPQKETSSSDSKVVDPTSNAPPAPDLADAALDRSPSKRAAKRTSSSLDRSCSKPTDIPLAVKRSRTMRKPRAKKEEECESTVVVEKETTPPDETVIPIDKKEAKPEEVPIKPEEPVSRRRRRLDTVPSKLVEQSDAAPSRVDPTDVIKSPSARVAKTTLTTAAPTDDQSLPSETRKRRRKETVPSVQPVKRAKLTQKSAVTSKKKQDATPAMDITKDSSAQCAPPACLKKTASPQRRDVSSSTSSVGVQQRKSAPEKSPTAAAAPNRSPREKKNTSEISSDAANRRRVVPTKAKSSIRKECVLEGPSADQPVQPKLKEQQRREEEGPKDRHRSISPQLQADRQPEPSNQDENSCPSSAQIKSEAVESSSEAQQPEGSFTTSSSVMPNNMLLNPCQLYKQGQKICVLRVELERGDASIKLPDVMDVSTRTTAEKLQLRLAKRPEGFTVWRLQPESETDRSSYLSFCEYFKSRQRIGLLETPTLTVFIVPLDSAATELATLCEVTVEDSVIIAFISVKNVSNRTLKPTEIKTE